jgi:hypothetical protein
MSSVIVLQVQFRVLRRTIAQSATRFCSGFEKILATLLPEGLRASLNCRIENL